MDVVKEYKYLLDYEYDNDLDNYHNQNDDGFEFLLDEFILKKEEHQIPEKDKFYGDEDC
jgi:DNA polymerase lambda